MFDELREEDIWPSPLSKDWAEAVRHVVLSVVIVSQRVVRERESEPAQKIR